MRFNGNEALKLDGKLLSPHSMLEFWQYNLSEIYVSMTRGSFATYIVACAMTDNGINEIAEERKGNEPYDIDGPIIMTPEGPRKSRIEVKSTSHVNEKNLERTLPDSKLVFSISEKIDWDSEDQTPRRHNDLYVFAHYTSVKVKDKEDILDMKNWEFYVLATKRIEADPELKEQHTVSVSKLKSKKVRCVGYSQLYDTIISELKDNYALV